LINNKLLVIYLMQTKLNLLHCLIFSLSFPAIHSLPPVQYLCTYLCVSIQMSNDFKLCSEFEIVVTIPIQYDSYLLWTMRCNYYNSGSCQNVASYRVTLCDILGNAAVYLSIQHCFHLLQFSLVGYQSIAFSRIDYVENSSWFLLLVK